MTMLVTLQQARDHLRSDTDADDSDLTLKIEAASSAVLNYLKGRSPYQPQRDSNMGILYDSNGDQLDDGELIREEVKHAVLILVAEFYQNRAGEQQGAIDSKFGYGYMPRPVVALLYPLRDPALA